MNKPLNPAAIAKAMREAAWIARHGKPEERAGRFIGAKADAASSKDEQARRRRK